MKQENGRYSNHDGEKQKQGELFAEFRVQQTGKTPYLKKRSMLPGKKFTLNLSCENTALISIAFIMLFVIFFSLGVEKGKRITLDNRNEHVAGFKNKLSKKGTAAEPGKVEIKENKEAEEKTTVLPLKLYTIQVIAFKKEGSAKREVGRLKGQGYDAFIIPSDRWVQVCIGKYINKEASMSDFNALKKKYPKCYFRKIND